MRRIDRRAAVLMMLAVAADANAVEPETLSAWKWYQEVTWDAADAPKWIDFVLTPSVFDKARPDLADLRLYDGKNRPVPYALRVRRAKDERKPLPAREFNRAAHPDRSSELSLDLGASPGEHNEIRVLMAGKNVRRRLHLDGGDDDKNWKTLLDKVDWMDFQAGDAKVDVHDFQYPISRFRYLRVRVEPDRSLEDDKPVVQSLRVVHSVRVPGETIVLPAELSSRRPTPGEGAPGSAWDIDLGARVPCEKLTFDIRDDEFVRPYRLQTGPNEESSAYLDRGEWRRLRGTKAEPMSISFSETLAHHLRLVVTDHRNPSLTIDAVRYSAPARQVIFAPPPDWTPPLRLYFGNPSAAAPHYDFAATLPEVLDPTPRRGQLRELTANPEYQPPPLSWAERWPWLVYVVLSATSLVLLILLALLGREAIAQHDSRAASALTE